MRIKVPVVAEEDLILSKNCRAYTRFDGQYYVIFIDPTLDEEQRDKTIRHELVHVYQLSQEKLIENPDYYIFDNTVYFSKDINNIGKWDVPWEVEARELAERVDCYYYHSGDFRDPIFVIFKGFKDEA